MNIASEATNKALVLVALDTLFNQRQYWIAEQYWAESLILHSGDVAPGRDGLFEFVRAAPATLRFEPGVIAANEDFVIVHGRISGNGRTGIGSPRSFFGLRTGASLSNGRGS